MHPIEDHVCIASRRWSAEEKERPLAASLGPDGAILKVACAAGIQVRQLFRWRK
ncbi:transposase [Shinella sp.]|uniref:transposase n=1 Tax=Shinella sp. TaxID=1870904 RepID=UPI0039181EE7